MGFKSNCFAAFGAHSTRVRNRLQTGFVYFGCDNGMMYALEERGRYAASGVCSDGRFESNPRIFFGNDLIVSVVDLYIDVFCIYCLVDNLQLTKTAEAPKS